MYFLALYNYEIYNQISLDSGENKLDEINKLYDISAIKRCITKQGFDFEASVELFNEIKPEERLVRGVNKFDELDSNLITEKYSFEINPKDIYNQPDQAPAEGRFRPVGCNARFHSATFRRRIRDRSQG